VKPLKVGKKSNIMMDKASISHQPPFLNTPFATAKHATQSSSEKIPVRRVPLQEIIIYDLRENELDALINGGRVSTYQAHATWSLSMALGFLSLVLAAGLPQFWVAVFALLTAAGFSVGLILLFFYLRDRKSLNGVVERIKARRSMKDALR
jgi:hypothetical protein